MADELNISREPAPAQGLRIMRGPPLVSSIALTGRAVRKLPIVTVLVFATLLYVVRLDRNGNANEYYTATVLSMTRSWKNFFFASFDPGGFITVDKPPVAFWLQALGVKIFGLNSWSLLLPEAIAGVLSVALLYEIVRRRHGEVAGFVAAAALALTPITAATVRINMPDPILVLVLLAAAWTGLRSIENGSMRWGLGTAALIGVAFNVKMLQAYLVVPAFALTWLLFAPNGLRFRLLGLAGAGIVLLAVSASWPLIVDHVPRSDRPYVGGSTDNSEQDLIFGYNGIGRVSGNELSAGRPSGAANAAPAQPGNQPPNPAQPFFTSLGRMFGGSPGWLRLFNDLNGAQVGWLIPFAAAGSLAALAERWKAQRTDRARCSVVFWTAWAIACAIVFSEMEGIYHVYYTILLAPALAALAGIGSSAFISLLRRPASLLWLLAPAALGTTALVEVVLLKRTPDWNAWLTPAVIAGAALAAGLLLMGRLLEQWRASIAGGLAAAAVFLGTGAMLVAPGAWSFSVLSQTGNGIDPYAGPASQGSAVPARNVFRDGFAFGGTPNPGLVSYLEKNRDGAKYLVATFGAISAAPIVIATGQPVMAMGGFLGSDPAPSLVELRRYIARREVRFVRAGGIGAIFGAGSDIGAYVRQNCKAVDASAYGGAARQPLYDCWTTAASSQPG